MGKVQSKLEGLMDTTTLKDKVDKAESEQAVLGDVYTPVKDSQLSFLQLTEEAMTATGSDALPESKHKRSSLGVFLVCFIVGVLLTGAGCAVWYVLNME